MEIVQAASLQICARDGGHARPGGWGPWRRQWGWSRRQRPGAGSGANALSRFGARVADGVQRPLDDIDTRAAIGESANELVNSPRIDKIEVVRHGVARRAQLYFLRDRVGKAATLRERRNP